MKKIISFVAVFLITGAVALQGKIKNVMIQEKGVTKTVEISIFVESDYSQRMYRKSKAKIFLTLYELKHNKQEIFWETIIDKGYLKNYPSKRNELFRKISIHNIHQHSEDIVISYKVVYDTGGSNISYNKSCLLRNPLGDTLLIGI